MWSLTSSGILNCNVLLLRDHHHHISHCYFCLRHGNPLGDTIYSCRVPFSSSHSSKLHHFISYWRLQLLEPIICLQLSYYLCPPVVICSCHVYGPSPILYFDMPDNIQDISLISDPFVNHSAYLNISQNPYHVFCVVQSFCSTAFDIAHVSA